MIIEFDAPLFTTARATSQRERFARHIAGQMVELYRRAAANQTALWGDEQEKAHPRGEGGKWVEKGELEDAEHSYTPPPEGAPKGTKGEYKLRLKSGQPLPEHLKDLRLPPAWRDIKVNTHPEAGLIGTGKDTKDRTVRKESPAYRQHQDAIKWGRTRTVRKELAGMLARNAEKAGETPDAHDLFTLISHMGLRPGSTRNTKAEKQAYGATTLTGRHVQQNPDGSVSLRFVGKKGVNIDLPVVYPAIAAMLLQRKQKAGDDGRLFATSAERLRQYVKGLGSEDFKTKDLRTAVGSNTAQNEVEKLLSNGKKPQNMREYKKAEKAIAVTVSSILGNKPAMALKAYIDPRIWDAIRPVEENHEPVA